MAKTLVLKRSTGQVSQLDTVNNILSPLGGALGSIPTSSTTLPCRIENLLCVYKGEPYALVVNTINNIEVRKYDLTLNAWGTSVTFAPVVGGNQAPHCLQIVGDKLVVIWNESNGINSVMSATYFNGLAWASRVNSVAEPNLNGNLGGHSVVWKNAVLFATKAGIGHYFVETGFGGFDNGTDPSVSNPLVANSTMQGCFAYWNNTLYFLQPDTGSGNRLMALPTTWKAPAPSAPQFETVSGVSGFVSAGVVTLTGDIGNLCLFVNKNDELCAMYSGAQGTKFVKTTVSTFPVFTNLSDSLLPTEIGTALNVGIGFYEYTMRRNNVIQYFLIRNQDSSQNYLKVAKWDGINSVEILQSYAGHDYLIPAGKFSEIRTYLGEQPAAYIVNVNSTQTNVEFATVVVTSLVGVVSVGDLFTITGATTATGTVFAVNGTTLTLNLDTGTIPSTGSFLDNTSLASATVSTVTLKPTTIVTVNLTGISGSINVGDRFSIVGSTSATGLIESVGSSIFTLNVATGTVPTSGAFTDTTTTSTATMGGTVIESLAFPGRAVMTYVVKDVLGRNIDIFGEYSVDGDLWSPMTQGSGDSGSKGINTSPTGTINTFFWDAYADLEGTIDQVFMRLIARLSIPSNEIAPSNFIPIIQEEYMRSPVFRNVSDLQISITSPSKAYTPGESLTTNNSGTTALVQTSIATIPVSTTVSFNVGDSFSAVSGPNAGTGIVKQILSGPARLVLDILNVTSSFPTSGTITDTTTSATATISGAPTTTDLTLTNVEGTFLFSDTVTGSLSTAAGTVSRIRNTLTVSNTAGTLAVGQTLTGSTSGATGAIIYLSLPTIVVDKISGNYTVGESFTTGGPGSGKIKIISSNAVVNTTFPADETVNLEEYTKLFSYANRGRSTYVFQGRLSSNQSKLRFSKLTVKGTGTSPYPKFKVNVYVSGQGAVNQYTGYYSNFTTLPTSDLEIIIKDNEITNQPSITGKRYSIVLEFEANPGETLTVSTPYSRHE